MTIVFQLLFQPDFPTYTVVDIIMCLLYRYMSDKVIHKITNLLYILYSPIRKRGKCNQRAKVDQYVHVKKPKKFTIGRGDKEVNL